MVSVRMAWVLIEGLHGSGALFTEPVRAMLERVGG